MTKAAARMMPLDPLGPDDERGVIVNTAPITAFEGQVGQGACAASRGTIAASTIQAAREFDMRDMYLKDITLMGCTAWDVTVFPNLISCIEKSEIKPLLAVTYPLARIADAQRAFQEKGFVGKIVLVPPR